MEIHQSAHNNKALPSEEVKDIARVGTPCDIDLSSTYGRFQMTALRLAYTDLVVEWKVSNKGELSDEVCYTVDALASFKSDV